MSRPEKEISAKDKHQQWENSESNLKPLEERIAVTRSNMKGLETILANIVRKRKKSLAKLKLGRSKEKLEKANQKLRKYKQEDMVVHRGQGLGGHYYSYTKDTEKSLGRPILFSHWLSKHYIPEERG